MYTVFCDFHPGGEGDRAQVLAGIRSTTGVYTTAQAARTALNQWQIQCARALELNVPLPVAFERYQAVKAIVGPVLSADANVSFRLQTLELQTGVPHQHTEEALQRLVDFAEGELQALCSAPQAPPFESQARVSIGPDQQTSDSEEDQDMLKGVLKNWFQEMGFGFITPNRRW